ncbi:MAG: hypothetical protein ABGX31_03805 [bacterium]
MSKKKIQYSKTDGMIYWLDGTLETKPTKEVIDGGICLVMADKQIYSITLHSGSQVEDELNHSGLKSRGSKFGLKVRR